MSETREVKCPACGEVLATVTLPEDTSEDRWARVLSGYVHTDCPKKEE
jgi:hypothetical protein